MRISDWSSDVCSSDLAWENAPSAKIRRNRLGNLKAMKKASVAIPAPNIRAISVSRTNPRTRESIVIELTAANDLSRFMKRVFRSEEHTSELQSLMRTSYAVFCLKKNKQYKI